MIEMGLCVIEFGCMFLIMWVKVWNIVIGEMILIIDKIVFVFLGEDGKFVFYGFIEIIYDCDCLFLDGFF